MDVDPRFKKAKSKARRRNSKLLTVWLPVGLCIATISAGVGYGISSGFLTFSAPEREVAQEVYDPIKYVTPFVDIPGDPMRIKLDTAGSGANVKPLAKPLGLSTARVPNDLVIVRDRMIAAEERFIATLPSSREDFAFFQLKREVISQAQPSLDVTGVATSSLTTTPEIDRQRPYEDQFARVKLSRSLKDFLSENGASAAMAEQFAQDAEIKKLNQGAIVALRTIQKGELKQPVQITVFDEDRFLGARALVEDGRSTQSADAWVEDDLVSVAEAKPELQEVSSRQFRLMDAFYSSAIRNGIPASVVGQSIVLLSQKFDMERFVGKDDEMTLIFSRAAGVESEGVGRILFIEIVRAGEKLQCYVYRHKGRDYQCLDRKQGALATKSFGDGMRQPVKGVVLVGFGPRKDPQSGRLGFHNGVQWAAPVGTPVVAAFDGQVEAVDEQSDWGFFIRLSHEKNRQTHYAHLSGFSKLAKVGKFVKAGDVIGYVGNTGQATDAKLYFEFYQDGKPVDPFKSALRQIVTTTQTSVPGQRSRPSSSGAGAVETLVNQIIRVESAGNPRAKNPLSTATGLGQFIESTWIRMMRTYRPDLARSLSRKELLSLRFDPGLSREMVTNLARENEAYLVARGHKITAGRLYLCHFLGAAGAHKVLSTDPNMLIRDSMGAGVVRANPFLKGRDGHYIEAWAERKMKNRRRAKAILKNAEQQRQTTTVVTTQEEVPSVDPEVAAYFQIVDNLRAGS